jgi:ATP-dependent helicase HrpB
MNLSLPILDLRRQIVETVQNKRNLVLRAPTGSGKSTQVPQMLLDSGVCGGRILILQPRRLAARMLASRVAEERSTALGTEIGFQTRFESLVSPATRACFITEGILTRLLMTDRNLDGVSAIIFDEFHERSLATDAGLALALDLQRTKRPDLRLIAMSATMDAGPLTGYLGDAGLIESPGRLFPIDIRYAQPAARTPVWDAAAEAARGLIAAGCQGDILVFMPGAYEIRKTVEAMGRAVRGEPVCVLPLYGDLPGERQRAVMEPSERRKIIVATNIAETSITVPGVRHVIDGGLARVNRYDQGRGFNTLFVEPIAKDSADQRAGRAGREAPGICIRLWSVAHHAGRSQRTTPEVLRVDLSELLLQLRQLGYASAGQFPWFERPTDAALEAGRELLVLLGALDRDGNLTDAGREMGAFPMHPRLGRLLLEAGKRGAVRLAAFSAALLSERTALSGKPDFPEESTTCGIASDFYAQYCLLEKVRASGFDPALCLRYGVSAGSARNILRTQALFLQYCRRVHMHTRDPEDAPEALARCMLFAYPDRLAVRKDKGTHICLLRGNRRGELSKDSVARKAEVLVVADIRETKDKNQALRTILSLATEVREQWLIDDFAEQWEQESSLEWNNASQAVENRLRTRCLDVTLSEKTGPITDLAAASGLLADAILSKGLVLDGWDKNAGDFIDRVRWLSDMFPDQKLPLFSDEDRRLVVHAVCEGETKYDRVKNKPVLAFLQQLLTGQQLKFVDSMAPMALMLPTGRRMKLEYSAGSPPRGRTRIQDLYGLNATPRVAGGKSGVLIELLAPNNRPVQITDDLASFWKNQYPELKKSLSRRYPKHEWR